MTLAGQAIGYVVRAHTPDKFVELTVTVQ
jgi:hypothetical protein